MIGGNSRQIARRALVIDDDQILNHQICQILNDYNIAEVDAAFDGQSGWEMVLGGDYEIIIMDWKLPELSGIALFNRIRGVERLMGTPVLVVSGLIQKMDFRLLREFPCTRLLEKPFNHAALIRDVDQLHSEGQWYAEHTEKISALMAVVAADPDHGLRGLKRLVADSPNPQPVLLLAARKLREAEHLELAINILKLVLENDRGSIPAISELGRCLHLLGRFDEAMQFLRRADSMSPANVERLSLMGEVALNRTDADAAHDSFSEALKIDHENRRARKGLRVAGTLAEMMHRPAGVHIKDTFASLMNTVAVNLAHSGEFSSAVERYEEAFHFIAGKEASAKVAFNIGLAYLRWGKIPESHDWFVESAKRGQGRFAKAQDYVEKTAERMRLAKEAAIEAKKVAAQELVARAEAQQAESEKSADGDSAEHPSSAGEHEQPS